MILDVPRSPIDISCLAWLVEDSPQWFSEPVSETNSPEWFSEPVSETDLKTMIDVGLQPFGGHGKCYLHLYQISFISYPY